MANKTIYPYGTDGQLPSSIGVINDLDTIRSGAAAGATAVQPGDLPTKVSDLANDAGYTANKGTVTGISVNGGSPVEPDNNGNVDLTIEEGSSAAMAAFTLTITSTTIEIQPMAGATMTVGNDISFQVV